MLDGKRNDRWKSFEMFIVTQNITTSVCTQCMGIRQRKLSFQCPWKVHFPFPRSPQWLLCSQQQSVTRDDSNALSPQEQVWKKQRIEKLEALRAAGFSTYAYRW